MVLVSFALVVVATITLVVGLLQSGLTLIYVSIGCSVLAGLVLAIAVLRGRPEEAPAAAPTRPTPVTTGGGPSTPPPTPAPTGRPWETARTSTGAETSSWGGQSTPPPPPAPPPPPPAPEPVREREYAGVTARPWASDSTQQMDAAAIEEEEEDEDFPIPDYDRLRASEILRLLPGLSAEDLERVRAREVSGMNRFTVLSRIDAQLETAAPSGWEIREQEWAGVPAADVGEEEELEEEEGGIEEEEEEPALAPIPRASRRTARAPRGAEAPARKAPGRRGAAAEAPAEPETPARKAPARRAPKRAAAAEPAATRAPRSRKTTPEPLAAPPAPPAEPAEPAARPARKSRTTAAPANITMKRGARKATAASTEAAKAPAKKKAAAKKAPPKKAPAAKKAAAKKAPAKKATRARKTPPR